MPARIELIYDANLGPGYAVGKITGLPGEPPADGLSIRIQRNQDSGYLRSDRTWGTSEAWLPLRPGRSEGDAHLVTFGPEIIDELLSAGASVRFMCHLRADGKLEPAGLTGLRGLRSSGGVGAGSEPEKIVPPPPPLSPPPVPQETSPPPPPPPPPPPSPSSPKLWGLLAALLLLLTAGGGAYWYLNQRTGGDAPVAAVDELKPGADQGNSPPPPTVKASIETLRDVNAFLQTTTSAETTLTEAQDLLKRGKKDLSLLLFQHAARGGSQEANVAMAHFYDPATWSTDTSPMPQADAETAAYWYEPAAEAGNVEAQRRLGKILVDLNMGGGQREKAVEWLHKAASAGDAEAGKLLETLK
jgi:hypothetical protein